MLFLVFWLVLDHKSLLLQKRLVGGSLDRVEQNKKFEKKNYAGGRPDFSLSKVKNFYENTPKVNVPIYKSPP